MHGNSMKTFVIDNNRRVSQSFWFSLFRSYINMRCDDQLQKCQTAFYAQFMGMSSLKKVEKLDYIFWGFLL